MEICNYNVFIERLSSNFSRFTKRWRNNWSSLYKYVTDYLDADLAICCSDKWNQNISLFEKAKYKWIFPEYEDYFQYYEENFSGTWKKYFDTGIDTGLYTSGSVHFVFKDIILKELFKNIKIIQIHNLYKI